MEVARGNESRSTLIRVFEKLFSYRLKRYKTKSYKEKEIEKKKADH